MTQHTIAEVLSGAARWCVLEGDNAPILAALGDKSVDHVIGDPPYSEHVHKTGVKGLTVGRRLRPGQFKGGKTHVTTIGFAALTDYSVVPQMVRVSRRWVLAFCAFEQLGEYRLAAPREYIRGGVYRRCNAAPQISGDRPAQSCDGIAIFHRKGRKRWNGGGTHAFWEAARDRGDVLHETPKPLALMRQLVELFTDPDDVVLDPYCGSGTTGAACLLTGRRFIGIEQNPVHVATSRERLSAIASGSTLAAARAGQMAMFGEVGT